MIFTLGMKLTFIGDTGIFFLQSQALRKFILKIFTEFFVKWVVVCSVELEGINNMWICPILSPYFSGFVMDGVSVSQ